MVGKPLNNPKTIQIIPASDWFFIHEGQTKPVVHIVAVWALKEDGTTVGLIGGVPTGPGSISPSPVSRLVGVPPVIGTYKHLLDLTQEERAALDSTS